MTTWGIDISNHQPTANLATAKTAGCGFVFAKATEGLTYTDPTFAGFRSKAAALGLPFGAYHFARPQPGRTGASEAAAFLKVLGDVRPGELPPVLDLETSNLGPAATGAWALDWLEAVERATGVRPLFYSYSAFIASGISAPGLAKYPLWLASYRTTEPPAPSPWRAWTFWQHTSSATVPGIPGSCDRNITHANVGALVTPQPETPALVEEDIPMSLTVKNPLTGEPWPVDRALWSSWTYAINAARDSAQSLAIVRAMAAKGSALSAAEIEAAAKAGAASALAERIESATVQLNTTTN